MDTITIHWGFAFALPLVGAFITRQLYARWQAWVAGTVMSLIGFSMIRFIGHGTNDYATGAVVGMAVIGALLPEIWHWARGFTQRCAPLVVGGVVVSGLYIINPGWLYYIACLGILAGAGYIMFRSVWK